MGMFCNISLCLYWYVYVCVLTNVIESYSYLVMEGAVASIFMQYQFDVYISVLYLLLKNYFEMYINYTEKIVF
jgi:hypothetical protein